MLVSDDLIDLDIITRFYNYTLNDIFGNYPIWDEEKRAYVNERLFEHFRFRKIASDTPAKFAFFAQRKMAEVMPQVNKVFEALEKDFSASMVAKSSIRAVNSNFPQTQLHGNEEYADQMTDQDTVTETNPANALVKYYTGINNALTLLYAELEPLFYQFWEED